MKFTRNRSGQSTIEFALALSFVLAFSMFFVHMALLSGFGSYVQYATFMAARAYLAAGPDIDDQRKRARGVLVRMLKESEANVNADRWGFARAVNRGSDANCSADTPGACIGEGPVFQKGKPGFSWQEGVRYSFRSKLFLAQLGGVGSQPLEGEEKPGVFTLTSESWLLREPSYQECVDALGGLQDGNEVIFDNGC